MQKGYILLYENWENVILLELMGLSSNLIWDDWCRPQTLQIKMSEQVKLCMERNERTWIRSTMVGWKEDGMRLLLNIGLSGDREKCGLLRTWKSISTMEEFTTMVTIVCKNWGLASLVHQFSPFYFSHIFV